jgi:hypothetical protein
MKVRIASIIILLFIVASCTPSTELESQVPLRADSPELTLPPPVILPIWPGATINDIAKTLNLESDGRLLEYSREINIKPKFYNGTIPIKLNIYRSYLGGNPGSSYEVISIYSGWANLFAYDDDTLKYLGIPTRAVTLDKNDVLLAEAKIIGDPKDGVFEIIEVHYNKNGEVIFWCKSKIGIGGVGFKEEEYDVHGKKETDYYFVWPASSY